MGGITNKTVHLSFAVDWSKEVNPLLLIVGLIGIITAMIGMISAILGIINFFYVRIINLKLDEKQNEYFFEGPWDEQKASQIFFKLLINNEQYNNFNFYKDGFRTTDKYTGEDGKCESTKFIPEEYQCKKGSYYAHGIYGFYHVMLNGKVSIIGLAYTKPAVNFECHVCRPLFSIVQYSQEKTGWSVTSFDPAVFYSGSWGSPMSELDVVEIGYGSFAIREQSGFFQAGYTEDYISFISRIKDKYVEIFSIMKTVTNGLKPDGEPKNCTLDVNIIPIGTSYYEIKTSSDGSDECPKVREETYFFNGKRYVSKGAHASSIFDIPDKSDNSNTDIDEPEETSDDQNVDNSEDSQDEQIEITK